MSKTVKGTKRLTSANTAANAVAFMIEQGIRNTVNTAEVVSIDTADQTGTDGPAGYADATPLVCQTDAFNNTLPPASIPKMPFLRPQAGKAAIVMDPQPGDKAMLVALKRDSSGVGTDTNDPVQPGSFRTFDQADGYLINGFLGETPEIWLHLNPATGDISLSTRAANIDISCRESGDIDIKTGSGNVTITCTDTATVKSPSIVLDGNVHVTGSIWWDGEAHGKNGSAARFRKGIVNESGGIVNTGGLNNTGGIVNAGGITSTGGVIRSNAVTLDTHTHRGVERGSSSTNSPSENT